MRGPATAGGIPFDDFLFDDGFFQGADAQFVTVPPGADGRYQITAGLAFAPTAGPADVTLFEIVVDGVTVLAQESGESAGPATTYRFNLSTTVDLVAGNTIALRLTTSAGGVVLAVPRSSPDLMLVRVGATPP